MKVFVNPTGLHSRAMIRVATALKETHPLDVEIVKRQDEADLVVLHVIGPTTPIEQDYVVIQYCGSNVTDMFHELWRNARFVWSYYNLKDAMPSGTPFLHAPLGVDRIFHTYIQRRDGPRKFDLITSGYSSGPIQEAIEEASLAVEAIGGLQVHIGPPNIEGMTRYPKQWKTQLGISDLNLMLLYHNARRVSGLRHVEGFELPALEGLLQGARPVVFDRPDMHQWYHNIAEFVPECHGEELIDRLIDLFKTEPTPVSHTEKLWVMRHFNWEEIGSNFWRVVSETERTVV